LWKGTDNTKEEGVVMKRVVIKLLIAAAAGSVIACIPAQPAQAQPSAGTSYQATTSPGYAGTSRSVRINNRTYNRDQLRRMGITGRVQPGNYWYDTRSGAWGYMGTGTRGFTRPGLRFGPMKTPPTNTKIYINGREITYREVMVLYRLLGRLAPGRYFVNANGDAGYEGGPVRVNLIRLAMAAQRRGSIHRNGTYSKGGCAGGYCSFQSKITGKHISWPN
jgi:hypothetical protein